ncbi:segregation and condensation protein B [Filimonas zeae]|uniref:Segregation and condensation protein B n=1 Tax=Filimonas zeae TaxID=1737353 RepID=A0A917J445_9BACT|nr:SMC-Scp complex subunit ScpB [Filimonas zeae]MDR6342172.1 segregation and condensation protein B [Filimonas zeae]GGH78824.1 hypothetical protein GCM10011379_47260 [Filimonas zeae]
MELSEIIPHIEVLIFASEKPLTSAEIAELINNAFGFMEQRITVEQVDDCMENIRDKYESEFFPFEVRESGGGWQFLTKKIFHKTVAQLNGDKFLKRLSNAAMETLAIIAYKQPITKGEIEGIRGVNSDYSIQKLLEKELIVITGRSEELPGKPLVYATSKSFMDYFGINSADDLPKIKEVLADQIVEATVVKGSAQEETAGSEEEETTTIQSDIPLAVDSSGALIPIEQEDVPDNMDASAAPDINTDELPANETTSVEPDADGPEENDWEAESVDGFSDEEDVEPTGNLEGEEEEQTKEDAADNITPDNNEDSGPEEQETDDHPEQQ